MQEQLTEFQQEMRDQMLELRRTMMSQFNRLLARELEKRKDPVIHFGVDNEDLPHSLDYTPTSVQVQPDGRPQGAFFTIRSQQYQTDIATPVGCLTDPRSNLRNNFPVALDNPAETK